MKSKIDKYMKTYKVANELYKNYRKINSEIDNINAGGCGVFAEHLYNTLKRLGLKPKLGVVTNSIKGINYRIKVWEMFGKDRYDLYGYHYGVVEHIVVILEDKLLVDSTGVYSHIKQHRDNYYHDKRLSKKLNLKVLKNWNKKGSFWNDEFDRDNERAIEDKLDACYNKVKKSLVVSNK